MFQYCCRHVNVLCFVISRSSFESFCSGGSDSPGGSKRLDDASQEISSRPREVHGASWTGGALLGLQLPNETSAPTGAPCSPTCHMSFTCHAMSMSCLVNVEDAEVFR